MQTSILKKLETKYSSLSLPNVKNKVEKQIKEFEKFAKQETRLQNPFYENEKLLKKRLEHFKIEDFTIENFKDDVEGFKEFAKLSSSVVNIKYFDDELKRLENKRNNLIKNGKKELAADYDDNLRQDIKLTTKLLHKKWQEALQQEYEKNKNKKLKELEKNFLKEIKKYLDKVQKIYDIAIDLEIEGEKLFDIENDLTNQDIKELQKWAKYIKDKNIKELHDMIKKLKTILKHKKQTAIITKKITSKQEIIELNFDNNLEYALPFESALLSNEETSAIFYKKYLEKSLLCFDFKIDEYNKLGPIIICACIKKSELSDNTVKAITLYVASQAKKQQRDCFLINFLQF